ncbi:MAG: septal ring lytic transglycosylase RlpA family protein [Stellaceae bacterium]
MSAARCLRRAAHLAAPLALTALLAACAGRHMQQSAEMHVNRPAPQPGQEGYYRVGTPYEVSGVWYYPHIDYHYDRTGVASWYGPKYDGRLTANGEIFDMNALSAAHPTLPLPSIVRVTDLQNGRSLDLRINDRGPFVDGRIIDLSRRAAQLLGFEGHGTAPVRVRVLKRRSIEVAQLARQGIIADGPLYAQAVPAAAPLPPVRVARAAPPPPPPPVYTPPQPAPVVIAAANPPPSYEPPAYQPPVYEQPAYYAPAISSGRFAEPRPAPPHVDFVAYRPPPRRSAGPMTYKLPDLRAIRPITYRLPGLRPARIAADYPPARIYVQAGAFSQARNAQRVRARVSRLASVRVSATAVRGVTLYRVRLGPFASVEEAHRVLSRVINGGYRGARLVSD